MNWFHALLIWYTACRKAALRQEDYWRYKDGETVDTDAWWWRD